MTTTPDHRAPDHRAPQARTAERRAPDARAPDHRAPQARSPEARASERGLSERGSSERGSSERRASAVPGSRAGEPRPARDLPRWVRWTVLPLMVLVPIGYVMISAEQSRDSGQSNQEEAAARFMTAGVPSSLQQRVYQVMFPAGATSTGYLETNSWDTSVLYAQFTTTAGGLDAFLAGIGTSRPALHAGRAAIPPAQARVAGWDLDARSGPWEGVVLPQPGDKPDHSVAVDLGDPDQPRVYVVSTVNFQHGFGGG